ncbi:hypothetical protein GUJ93_ZPchr0014g47483 [Zizania palustris]|uniref:Uncharacterized protein n=1 Tax=Zizania palustris TaxID=103762 RepID=A0A8J5W0V7_ZIZPA|nr:hypothetical protein GUJ93_ZPchr0014g47483 [Zizania palustris]
MRQLKLLTAAATALLVVVFLVSFIGSCEAHRLHRACGKVSSTKPSSSPSSALCKDVKNSMQQLHGSDRTTNRTKDLSDAMDGHVVGGADAKAEEGVAAMAPSSSTGAVETKIVVRVSNKRLSHQVQGEDDTGSFHLDYAGPRAHPPSHNW